MARRVMRRVGKIDARTARLARTARTILPTRSHRAGPRGQIAGTASPNTAVPGDLPTLLNLSGRCGTAGRRARRRAPGWASRSRRRRAPVPGTAGRCGSRNWCSRRGRQAERPRARRQSRGAATEGSKGERAQCEGDLEEGTDVIMRVLRAMGWFRALSPRAGREFIAPALDGRDHAFVIGGAQAADLRLAHDHASLKTSAAAARYSRSRSRWLRRQGRPPSRSRPR